MRHDHENERYVIVEREESSLAPFLLGLAIGAGAALLLAPRSGEDTRRMIGDRARKAGSRAKEAIDDVTASVQSQWDEARARVEAQFEDATDAVRRGRRRVSDAVDAGRSAAHEARRELRRKLDDAKLEAELAMEEAATRTDGRPAARAAAAGDDTA